MHILRTVLILLLLVSVTSVTADQIAPHQADKTSTTQSNKPKIKEQSSKQSLTKSKYCKHAWYKCPQFYKEAVTVFTFGCIVGTFFMVIGASPYLGSFPQLEYHECRCLKSKPESSK